MRIVFVCPAHPPSQLHPCTQVPALRGAAGVPVRPSRCVGCTCARSVRLCQLLAHSPGCWQAAPGV